MIRPVVHLSVGAVWALILVPVLVIDALAIALIRAVLS